MHSPLLIVEQSPADQVIIDQLLDQAFGLSRRIKTSYRLREGAKAAEGLSLVIRDDKVLIAGAISFWPLAIGELIMPALLLGPLVVHRDRQKQGLGSALMQEGLRRAKAAGYRLVLLVGDAPYYQKAGFLPVPQGQLALPGPVDPARFLYLELVPGALAMAKGLVLAAHRRNIGGYFTRTQVSTSKRK